MKRASLVVAGFLVGAVLALQVPVTAQPADDEPFRRTITVNGTSTSGPRPTGPRRRWT
jgi:hypothetical protein